ncbi:MAG: response regulator [Limnobacter sp.]|nr:response regulator [Limnobacter sp.]
MSVFPCQGSAPKILVVDGSPVDLDAYALTLRKWGYEVITVSSGAQALALLSQEKIHLVLADGNMPQMNGIELSRNIRRVFFGHYIYVMLFSAPQGEAFVISALEAGADDVLNKPADINELEARLQSAWRRIALQAKLAAQNQQVAQAHDLIAQELRTVSQVQRSYLPAQLSPFPEVAYRWLSVPSQYVSGDHLHVFRLNDDLFGFYVLDVSGHGIPAAVKSMQLVQMFSDLSPTSVVYEKPAHTEKPSPRQAARPRDVVGNLNRIFQQTETDLSYFTLIYGTFQPHSGRLAFCQAGHPNPLVLRANGEVASVGEGGYPVGLFEFDEFTDTELILEAGDTFMLYSDGVTEVVAPDEQQFGQVRLLNTVSNAMTTGGWASVPEALYERIKQWGGPQALSHGFEDDLSVLILGARTAGSPQEGAVESQDILDAMPLAHPSPQAVFRPQVQSTALEASSSESSNSSDTAPHTVLIADDSKSFLRIFEAMLSNWGYQVYTAQSGHEALALVEEKAPDFVLTDWDMPGMSGIELCEQIRATEAEHHVYLIMVTGFASREDLLRSLRVGADDFLTKPVNPSELKVRLNTAIRISRLYQSLQQQYQQIKHFYGALQRDMREVSRIQRALLPPSRNEPWPVAVQTLYSPRRFVCGCQMGTLKTHDNELGFFMINLPGEGTPVALQAMAVARWFSDGACHSGPFPP